MYDGISIQREGRLVQTLALLKSMSQRQGSTECVLLLDLVYADEPVLTRKHFVERIESRRRRWTHGITCAIHACLTAKQIVVAVVTHLVHEAVPHGG